MMQFCRIGRLFHHRRGIPTGLGLRHLRPVVMVNAGKSPTASSRTDTMIASSIKRSVQSNGSCVPDASFSSQSPFSPWLDALVRRVPPRVMQRRISRRRCRATTRAERSVSDARKDADKAERTLADLEKQIAKDEKRLTRKNLSDRARQPCNGPPRREPRATAQCAAQCTPHRACGPTGRADAAAR